MSWLHKTHSLLWGHLEQGVGCSMLRAPASGFLRDCIGRSA